MKRIFWIFIVSMLFLIAGCSKDNFSYQYISIHIGPKVDILLDKNNKVTHYAMLNEEAEIMLADQDLRGLSFEDAIITIINNAVFVGYIDILTSDNVIALYAESSYDNDFQDKIKDLITGYLFDQAFGCVVVEQESVGLLTNDNDNQNEFSIFTVKMIETLKTLNQTIDEEQLFDKRDELLYKDLKDSFDHTFDQFLELRKADRLVTQTAYMLDLSTLVFIYRDHVQNLLITQPDLTSILSKFTNDYQNEIELINQRNAKRDAYMQEIVNSDITEIDEGTYEASVFSGDLPYILDYYRVIFYEGNTYAESWSITSGVQNTTSDYVGSYSIVDGRLETSYPGTQFYNLFLANGNVCAYDQDGNLLVFQEIIE